MRDHLRRVHSLGIRSLSLYLFHPSFQPSPPPPPPPPPPHCRRRCGRWRPPSPRVTPGFGEPLLLTSPLCSWSPQWWRRSCSVRSSRRVEWRRRTRSAAAASRSAPTTDRWIEQEQLGRGRHGSGRPAASFFPTLISSAALAPPPVLSSPLRASAARSVMVLGVGCGGALVERTPRHRLGRARRPRRRLLHLRPAS